MPCLHLHYADGAVGRIGALFKIAGVANRKVVCLAWWLYFDQSCTYIFLRLKISYFGSCGAAHLSY